MEVETNTGKSWREECIMSYETNGDERWNLTKKEKIVRCERCRYFRKSVDAPLGLCERAGKVNAHNIVIKKLSDYCSSGVEK